MIDRRALVTGLALALLLATGTTAADRKPFDAEAFEAAQAAGKPILVEVHAPWCPVCKAQQPILSNLTSQPRFKDLAVFQIDFDSQKAILRRLKVQQQSTLIAFRGRQEVGRSTGDTNAASIEALLSRSL